MPLDGVTLACVVHELTEKLLEGRVDKIAQPEEDELIIAVRARGQNHKLLLSANASSPRLQLTQNNKPGPLQAPMFCMLLRKHLSGGKILRIVQPDFERIAELHIESMNELGDRSVKRLVIEIMGKHSNIILLDNTETILDSVKHVSHDVSAVREVLPGKKYERPPSKDKYNPLVVDRENFFERLLRDEKLKIQQAIYQSFSGISPVMASELCLLSAISPDTFAHTLEENEKTVLYNTFEGFRERINGGGFDCRIYYSGQDHRRRKTVDFAALPLTVYAGHTAEAFASPSQMLEAFYLKRDRDYRLAQKTADLRKLINGQIERCVKKRTLYDKTLAEIKDRDRLRTCGELLTAYIHLIEKGTESFTAQNFYDDGHTIDIPLDPSLSPSENAQRYFKQYNKQKRTYAALQSQMRQNDEDLQYLDSVAAAMQNVTEDGDITDIRTEMAEQGFLKKKNIRHKPKARTQNKPLRFMSADGYEIFVGKNNSQNDELTLRTAQNGDIWLHTKEIAGSHVIIKTNGTTPPDGTIYEAAGLAAYYSKAREGSQVPVDYTLKKFVKKPNGAKPGYVIYDRHKTVYITPEEPVRYVSNINN